MLAALKKPATSRRKHMLLSQFFENQVGCEGTIAKLQGTEYVKKF